MIKSETTKELFPAMLKVQEQLETLKHDTDNPFFKSTYASLTQIVEYVKPLLNKQGLFFVQVIVPNDSVCVETAVIHAKSGEYITSTIVLDPVKRDNPQAIGSAISYAKRYTLSALLGVTSESEDDDGNKASGAKPKSQPAKAAAKSGGDDFL